MINLEPNLGENDPFLTNENVFQNSNWTNLVEHESLTAYKIQEKVPWKNVAVNRKDFQFSKDKKTLHELIKLNLVIECISWNELRL